MKYFAVENTFENYLNRIEERTASTRILFYEALFLLIPTTFVQCAIVWARSTTTTIDDVELPNMRPQTKDGKQVTCSRDRATPTHARTKHMHTYKSMHSSQKQSKPVCSTLREWFKQHSINKNSHTWTLIQFSRLFQMNFDECSCFVQVLWSAVTVCYSRYSPFLLSTLLA